MSDFIRIEGASGSLDVYETKIVITSKGLSGFLTKGISGSKEIPYSSITAIQYKEAGGFLNGYIQFTIRGGKESKGGLFDATRDENSFVFIQANNEEMKKAKDFIQERIGNNNNGIVRQEGIATKISKLKDLEEKCIISSSEFQAAKKKILNKVA